MGPNHPYREPGSVSTDPLPPDAAVRPDDMALALILLVAGALGIAAGVSSDRHTELTLGLISIALAARVTWPAPSPGDS